MSSHGDLESTYLHSLGIYVQLADVIQIFIQLARHRRRRRHLLEVGPNEAHILAQIVQKVQGVTF